MKPLAPKRVYTDRARLRAGPSGKVVLMMASPVGAVRAAQKPFTKRVAISTPGSLVRPLSTEAAAKTRSATR